MTSQPRNFLEIDDLTPAELVDVLRLSMSGQLPPLLEGSSCALVFEKPSARTRHSVEMAVVQLRGHPLVIRPEEIQLGVRESIADIARTFGCYHSVVGLRVFSHQMLAEFATASPVPVVNLLSDQAHPLQALADLLTLAQEWKLTPADMPAGFAGRKVAYIGAANNVARSLALGCAMMGVEFCISCPPAYGFKSEDTAPVLSVLACQSDPPACYSETDPAVAVKGADAVYTDVWASMGEEDEAAQRRKDFAGYTVTTEFMWQAAPEAIFLHCLPAHRGEEVSAEVLEGPRSRVWRQAENRMHTARGLLAWLMGARP